MITVVVQRESRTLGLPSDERVYEWAVAAMEGRKKTASLTVRMVDQEEGAELNSRYRGLSGSTNVLSFPFDVPEFVGSAEIGDIVVCAPVVMGEARVLQKTPEQHWAHMVVHGCLHLLGYDHQSISEAGIMEGMEAEILGRLGYPHPYSCEH